jgi:hypothetical protein
MRRPVAIALICLALFGLAGCKGACRQLSEKLCDCNLSSLEREACVRRVINDEALIEPTAENEATCQGLLDETDPAKQCTCDNYQTDQGKQACGLAR